MRLKVYDYRVIEKDWFGYVFNISLTISHVKLNIDILTVHIKCTINFYNLLICQLKYTLFATLKENKP